MGGRGGILPPDEAANPVELRGGGGPRGCLYHLGEKLEAVREWDEAIERFKAEAGTDPRPGLAAYELARALLGRALISMELGPHGVDSALDDVSDARGDVGIAPGPGREGDRWKLLFARVLEAVAPPRERRDDARP